MNWKGYGKWPWPNSWYQFTVISQNFVNELRKTTKALSQDSPSPGPNLNQGPLLQEAAVLAARLQRSVTASSLEVTLPLDFVLQLFCCLTLYRKTYDSWLQHRLPHKVPEHHARTLAADILSHPPQKSTRPPCEHCW